MNNKKYLTYILEAKADSLRDEMRSGNSQNSKRQISQMTDILNSISSSL